MFLHSFFYCSFSWQPKSTSIFLHYFCCFIACNFLKEHLILHNYFVMLAGVLFKLETTLFQRQMKNSRFFSRGNKRVSGDKFSVVTFFFFVKWKVSPQSLKNVMISLYSQGKINFNVFLKHVGSVPTIHCTLISWHWMSF